MKCLSISSWRFSFLYFFASMKLVVLFKNHTPVSSFPLLLFLSISPPLFFSSVFLYLTLLVFLVSSSEFEFSSLAMLRWEVKKLCRHRKQILLLPVENMIVSSRNFWVANSLFTSRMHKSTRTFGRWLDYSSISQLRYFLRRYIQVNTTAVSDITSRIPTLKINYIILNYILKYSQQF